MNSVGSRIREARIAKGLTQAQLAHGVATKGFISQVERDRSMPSLPKLRIMADRLGIPLSTLTGEPSPLEVRYLRKSAELATRAGEPQRALEIVDEGMALPSTGEERADLYRARGLAYDALGQHDQALLAFQAAAAVAPADSPELSGSIYVEIGTVLQEQERFNAALEANQRALEWLDRTPHADPALRSRLLTNLGVESFELGQSAQARIYFEQALRTATDAESRLRIANAHMALGVVARAAGDLDRALEHCNRALDLYRRLDDDWVANRVLNNLGDVHHAAGRRDKALECQERCLDRARQLQDTEEVGVAAGALARYAVEDGNLDRALTFAQQSQAAARQVGDDRHEAVALVIEAEVAEIRGRRNLSDRLFRRALRLLIDRQAVTRLAEASVAYADVLRDRGDVDRAFALMRMASEREFKNLWSVLRGSRLR